MKYEMKHDADIECIVCELSGQLHLSDLPQYGSDLTALFKKHNCKRVLQDLTEVDLELSIFDFLEAPKLARDKGIGRDVKRATVFAKDAEDWEFYETVSFNRGELVRVFSDFNQAKQWLME